MPVFKAYLLVIKRNIPSLLIYFFVFVAMAVIFLKFAGNETYADFTAVKSDIIVISGEETPFVDGFIGYLEEYADIISVGEDDQSIQDALFFGKADYALTIPAGFTESFLSGTDDVALEKMTAGLSSGTVNIDLLISKYLGLSRLYINNVPGITQEDINSSVIQDLTETSTVELKQNVDQAQTNKLADTFRYLAYPILAIMLMGITSIMLAFNEAEVSRRNSCAPLSTVKANLQLFMGNALLTVVVWSLLCLVSIGLSGDYDLGPGIRLLCLNALVASIIALSIAFLAGQFIKGAVAQAALTNVVSLGTAFISGVFIPQYVLGETVLKIASFTPYYWYIRAVDAIGSLNAYSFDDLRPVLGYMLVQLSFAAAFIIIALVAAKQKRLKRAS
jgi:ABC-2 type transport system permease protein